MNRALPFLLTLVVLTTACQADRKGNTSKTFSFEMNFNYPAEPEVVYDHLTGDVSGWWDHSFSGDPYKLYIEAKPGGGFYEVFDESGDGVRHASVILAKRGKMLRMEGPFGLSGRALTMVCTYTLRPSDEGGTLLNLTVNGAGDFSNETPGIVKQVWEHFLWEQFRPYLIGSVSP